MIGPMAAASDDQRIQSDGNSIGAPPGVSR